MQSNEQWTTEQTAVDATIFAEVRAKVRAAAVIKLHLGCGRDIWPGWVNVDKKPLPGVEVVRDLEILDALPLPYEDSSVSEFAMVHVLEHIRDTLGLMAELHRVAKPDARLTIRLPYGGSDGAWEDQTHVRAYFPKSFGFFSQPYNWRADYGYRGDWQPERITLFVPESECASGDVEAIRYRVEHERNLVLEMEAVLRCIKPIRNADRRLIELPLYVIRPATVDRESE